MTGDIVKAVPQILTNPPRGGRSMARKKVGRPKARAGRTKKVSKPRGRPKKARLPRTVKASKTQTGKRKSLKSDIQRKAMSPGKRLSKNKKTYYEYRRNRTDIKARTPSGKTIYI